VTDLANLYEVAPNETCNVSSPAIAEADE